MDTKKEIIESIQAGIPGIYLQTAEDLRADLLIQSVADACQFKVREWNLGYGWVDFKNKRLLNNSKRTSINLSQDINELIDIDFDDPTLIVIKNTKLALEGNNQTIAQIQQLLLRIQRYYQSKSSVIFISESKFIPSSLNSLITLIELTPPSQDELRHIINSHTKVSSETIRKLLSLCSGMNEESVKMILKRALNKYKKIDTRALRMVQDEKKQIVAKSGVIEMVQFSENIDDIGGLENLKSWLRRKERIIGDLQKARDFGIANPKGVLIAGMSGCGKSLTAKAAASLFELPLLRLDIGSILGKYVGESEANMKKALKMAEQIDPCVLWIDELEKAFSGIGSNSGNEVTIRLFGYFLTWMQEKPGSVFVIATANDVSVLPPELLRKGRFDEVFYVDFPNESERAQIFEIHLKKAKKNDIDITKLSIQTEGYSGADIQGLINDALETAFIQGTQLSQKILEKSKNSIIPLNKTFKSQLEKNRKKFEEYKLKPASLSKQESKNFLNESKSSDPIIRENIASNIACPSNILEKLSKDDDMKVRQAVLKNKNCPEKIIMYFLENFQGKPDFSKPFTWNETISISQENFNLALSHEKASEIKLFELFKNNVIGSHLLLKIAENKRPTGELLQAFSVKVVKLSSRIQQGQIREIKVVEGDLVTPNQRLLEVDDESGTNLTVTFPFDGLIKEIHVSNDQSVKAGQLLIKIMVPKKQS